MTDQGTTAPIYWCHECQGTVVPVTTPSEVDGEEELACTSCGSAFIEALESDDVDHPQEFHAVSSSSPSSSSTSPSTNNNTQQGPADGWSNRIQQVISQMMNPGSNNTGADQNAGNNNNTTTATTNPMLSGLQEMTSRALREHLSESGTLNPTGGSPHIEVIFTDASGSSMMNLMENAANASTNPAQHRNVNAALFQTLLGASTGPGAGAGGAQFGDYAFGNIGSIINQLMQQDSNSHGAPPASKKVVKDLPLVALTSEDLEALDDECPVCKDTFDVGDQVKRLPCSHFFHPGCILPWLEQHNSCPTCRYELKTDDPDYEQQRESASSSSPSSSSRPNP